MSDAFKPRPIIHENGDATFENSLRFPPSEVVAKWEMMDFQGKQGYYIEATLDGKSYFGATQRELRDWLLLYEQGLA